MMRATAFQGKSVAVLGLGRSGLAACRALDTGGANVTAWDDSEAGRQSAADAGFTLTDLKTAAWEAFDTLVLSPGIPLTHPEPHWSVKMAQFAGVDIIGDVEIFSRQRALMCHNAPFVAVTGTNGKSTTTALIAHILQTSGRDAQMGGNIGVPILDLAPPSLERVHVIELSSYQIDLMPTLKPSLGILLNISPDHLDRHGGLSNYISIKARVPACADFAIIGIDDIPTREIFATEKANRTTLTAISAGTVKHGIGVENRKLVRHTSVGKLFAFRKRQTIASLDGIISLRGAHNAQNAAAATAACLQLGLNHNQITTGLKTFAGLPHRLEEVGRAGRIVFINDSKATNAESAAHALAAFHNNIYWIVGGRPKAGGIASLSAYFPRIAKAYVIGEAADAFAQTLKGKCAVANSQTLAAAVRQAAADAAGVAGPQAVVLLSPACASFDQFRSFEARGEAFRALVNAVPEIEMRKGAA